MKSPTKTKELIKEIDVLKKRIQVLEQYEAIRRQTEEARQESDRRFESLVEATSDWIWEINTDWIYTYASPKVKNLLGYEPEEIIGKTPFDLMSNKEIDRVSFIFNKIAESRRPFSGLENKNLHKDGHEIVLESNGVPIYDIHGNFQGYRGFDRDITERKRAEDALRTSRLRLLESMELAHIVYWEIDSETKQFVFNDPFYTLHGTTAVTEGGYMMAIEEYAGRFLHPDDLQHFSEAVEKSTKINDTEYVVDFKDRIVRRDGQVRHVLTRTRFIRSVPDEPMRVYGATQDITDRKLAEEERERLIIELREALSQVKMLSGLLPICSSCKKIRNDAGKWEMMEVYIRDHSEADFSHGLCPECAQRLYPEFYKKNG